jgi:hypothetical protein
LLQPTKNGVLAGWLFSKPYIPLETKQIIPPEVLEGVRSQTVAAEIVECRSPGITDSQRNPHYHRYEAVSRNMALDLMKVRAPEDGEAPYAVMQDSDIQHLKRTNFEEMVSFLDKNPPWGGAALYQGPSSKSANLEPRHVRLSCIMLRNELWNVLRFDENSKGCLCNYVSDAIRKAGFRFGFLDADNGRIKEILDRDKRHLPPGSANKPPQRPAMMPHPARMQRGAPGPGRTPMMRPPLPPPPARRNFGSARPGTLPNGGIRGPSPVKTTTIVFCLPGNSFSGKFLERWTALVAYCLANNIRPVLSRHESNNIYYVRNMCLGADVMRGVSQKPFDGKIDYDYLMWIDADILFTPPQLARLLGHGKDIVSGLYLMDGGSRFATVTNWDEEHFIKNGSFNFLSAQDIEGKGGLIDVSYTGMGFMLVRKGVFESLEYPWFKPIEKQIGSMVDFTMEDVAFCLRAKEKGYKILIDPEVRVGHEKRTIL